MDKLERLMTLTATLLNTTRALTAEELRTRIPGYAERDDSFRRQFERDKDDLREMGIPLVVEETPGTDPPVLGYRIDRAAYYLDDPGFEADELAALHLALSLVQVEGISGTEGLWNLGGVVGSGAGPASGDAVLTGDPALATVYRAIAERRRLTLSYKGRARTLDPYRLDYQRGRWYLTAFDHGHDEERSFRLDRIDGEVELGPAAAFELPATTVPGARAPAWQLGEEEPFVARLLVDRDRAFAALHDTGDDALIHERPDGSVELELTVTNEEAFRTFALGFLEHGEVLAPPSMRAAMIAWLEALS